MARPEERDCSRESVVIMLRRAVLYITTGHIEISRALMFKDFGVEGEFLSELRKLESRLDGVSRDVDAFATKWNEMVTAEHVANAKS